MDVSFMPGALRSVWHLVALIPLSKSSTCLGPPTGPQALEVQVGPACLGTFPRCHTLVALGTSITMIGWTGATLASMA